MTMNDLYVKSPKLRLLYLFVFLGIFNLNALQAQKLKKQEYDMGPIKLIYTKDKKTKLFEGEYLKTYTKTNDTLCFGRYENGNRIGEWRFTSNDLNFIYNYDSKDFRFLDTLFKANNEFYIKQGRAFKLAEVDRPAIYLDSELELKLFLNRNIRIPEQVRKDGIEDYAVASIVVDSLGDFKFYRIEKAISDAFDKEMISVINKLPNTFLPAVKDGIAIDSKIYLTFNIASDNQKVGITETHYRLVVNIVYYKVRLDNYYLNNRYQYQQY